MELLKLSAWVFFFILPHHSVRRRTRLFTALMVAPFQRPHNNRKRERKDGSSYKSNWFKSVCGACTRQYYSFSSSLHQLLHDSNRLRAIKIQVFFLFCHLRFYSWVYCTSYAIVLVIYHKFVVHMPSHCHASSLNRKMIENSNNMIFDSWSTWFS